LEEADVTDMQLSGYNPWMMELEHSFLEHCISKKIFWIISKWNFFIIINYNVHTSNSFSRCFENWLKFSKTIPKNMATLHYKSTKAFLYHAIRVRWFLREWKINQYLHWNSHKQILMGFPSMFVNHTQTKEYIEYNSKKIDPISQHSNVIISTYMHLA
jgi:hypothetical protein